MACREATARNLGVYVSTPGTAAPRAFFTAEPDAGVGVRWTLRLRLIHAGFMDSITQAALGAAVGEAVLGRRVGAKAAAWGAALGTLPDLDVLVNPFVSEVAALYIHRGLTHGLLFGFVLGPIVGALLARLHRRDAVPWSRWAILAVLVLVTHPLLDALTVYGTQLFSPFSDYPVILAAVSIIDPLYTVPLLLGIVVAVASRRGSRRRAWANGLGLAVSTGYLLFALGVKAHVADRFEAALQAQGLGYERLLTAPTLANTLLWMGLATDDDGTWVGHYSLFDAGPIRFTLVPKHAERLAEHRDDLAVRRLLWFTRGFYATEARGGDLLVHDLRFGRTDVGLTEDAPYVFTFRLHRAPDGTYTDFSQQPPSFDALGAETWTRFWHRIWGDDATRR